jgi:3-methyladenine DNA glycosylase/8-oxoguanine DNA glycosylase
VVESWGLGADWLLDRAARLCGALDDLSNFTPDQPLLRALKHRHPGMRVGRSEAVFEACMRNIVQQRVTVQEAWLNWRSLVRGLGEPAPGTLPDLWLPPPAERVARLPYDMFHRFGIERRRADILRRVALVAARLEEAVTLPLEQAHRRLSSVVGLGPWTTARVALVALGDADAVCLGDLHLPHLISWVLAGEPRGSDARMLELLEPYRGHRARVQRLLLIDALSVPRVRQNLA